MKVPEKGYTPFRTTPKYYQQSWWRPVCSGYSENLPVSFVIELSQVNPVSGRVHCKEPRGLRLSLEPCVGAPESRFLATLGTQGTLERDCRGWCCCIGKINVGMVLINVKTVEHSLSCRQRLWGLVHKTQTNVKEWPERPLASARHLEFLL